MIRTAGPIRRVWERRKRAAFPPGALTFHLDVWTRRTVSPEVRAASEDAMKRFRFDELLVVHGSAWLHKDHLTLVNGPPGIGKTTVLRNLGRSGVGHLVEDGLLLLGLRADRLHLLLTGTLDVLERSSRIGSRVRSLMGVRYCFHQTEDAEVFRRANPIRSAVLSRLPFVSFTLATASGPRPGRPFTPTSHEVGTVIVMPHPQDPARTLRLRCGQEAEEVADLTSLVPAKVSVFFVSPIGDLPEVRDRLRQAIVSVQSADLHGPGTS